MNGAFWVGRSFVDYVPRQGLGLRVDVGQLLRYGELRADHEVRDKNHEATEVWDGVLQQPLRSVSK